MSGPELAQRRLASCPDIEIMYISGYSGDRLNQTGVLEPRAVMLKKPFAPTELASEIRARLEELGDDPSLKRALMPGHRG